VVFAQSPKGGASAALGSIVTIMVSNGKAPKAPVPNVVGETQEGATNILKAEGFEVAVAYQEVSDHKQDGIVLSQSPKGGKKASPGTTVTILVGKFQSGPSP
jgi:serine/threonine-protein kinase